MIWQHATWADAEALYPGIEAEWTELAERGGGVGLTRFPAQKQIFTAVALELHHTATGWEVHVVDGGETAHWPEPRRWIRDCEGSWRSPMPRPEFKLLGR